MRRIGHLGHAEEGHLGRAADSYLGHTADRASGSCDGQGIGSLLDEALLPCGGQDIWFGWRTGLFN